MKDQSFKLKAVNSDSETCEACGKTGLKKVMWLDQLDAEGNETGNVRAMGTTCGARALGFNSEFAAKMSGPEQVREAIEYQVKLDEMTSQAQEVANEFNDEVGILKGKSGWGIVRGKAFDVAPERYGYPKKWVKPE